MKEVVNNLKIGHRHGVHIRIATEIVKTSGQFECEITLFKISLPDIPINAKAILDLMTAGLEYDEEVNMVCKGKDAEKAAEVMEYVLTSNFDKDG